MRSRLSKKIELSVLHFLQVQDVDPVTDPGNLPASGHLESDIPSIIAHDRIGCFIDPTVVEPGQALPDPIFRVQFKFPQINMGSCVQAVMPAGFNERILPVREDPLGFIITVV
jgi:hypothetical protein